MRRVLRIPRLPRRRRDAHKGDFGRVLVVGGSRGMLGAPALCANAALRSGAGLARIATESAIQPFVATLAPCATTIPHPDLRHAEDRRSQAMSSCVDAAWLVLEQAIESSDVTALGPGWSVHPVRRSLLERFLRPFGKPLVIDADGLNNLAHVEAWGSKLRRYQKSGGSVVLTPHPGEMQRLLDSVRIGRNARTERTASAVDLARACGAVIVLKGAGTIVTDGERIYANHTGNPGMATGGTGDVLTGVITALAGQGMSGFDAAVSGVYAHGLAGDLAVRQLGETSLIATDLLDYLPKAFRSMQRRR